MTFPYGGVALGGAIGFVSSLATYGVQQWWEGVKRERELEARKTQRVDALLQEAASNRDRLQAIQADWEEIEASPLRTGWGYNPYQPSTSSFRSVRESPEPGVYGLVAGNLELYYAYQRLEIIRRGEDRVATLLDEGGGTTVSKAKSILERIASLSGTTLSHLDDGLRRFANENPELLEEWTQEVDGGDASQPVRELLEVLAGHD